MNLFRTTAAFIFAVAIFRSTGPCIAGTYNAEFSGTITSVTGSISGYAMGDPVTGSYDLTVSPGNGYSGDFQIDGGVWNSPYADAQFASTSVSLVADADVNDAMGPGFLPLVGDFSVDLDLTNPGAPTGTGFMRVDSNPFGSPPYDIAFNVTEFNDVPEPACAAITLFAGAGFFFRRRRHFH